jgi:translation initiation factor 2 subunit 2
MADEADLLGGLEIFEGMKKKKKKIVTEETREHLGDAPQEQVQSTFVKDTIGNDQHSTGAFSAGLGISLPSLGTSLEISGDPAPLADAKESWDGTDRDYTYQELLDRAFKFIRQDNPNSESGHRRFVIPPPQVVREGTKKTLFTNISEICKRIHRPQEHLVAFLLAELGTTGSVDKDQMLVIKGRFQPAQIESLLRNYIVEYVTCKTCRYPDTVLTKENRLTFMQCQACGSRRSVAPIQSGFSAKVNKKKE